MGDGGFCHYCRKHECECPQTVDDAIEYLRPRAKGVFALQTAVRMLIGEIERLRNNQMESTTDANECSGSSVCYVADVLQLLKDLYVVKSVEVQPFIKPSHGPCCTCQTCGYHHDDCVCEDNEIIEAIRNLPKSGMSPTGEIMSKPSGTQIRVSLESGAN